MWFKNLIVYRMPANWEVDADALAENLQPMKFAEAASLQDTNVGWVAPHAADPRLVCALHRQMLLTLRQEKKLLPAKVVAQVLKQRVDRIEEEEGFRPGRKRMKELKEAVRDELLPRAFSLSSDTRAWIDPDAGWLVVDAASANRADELIGVLARAVPGFPGRLLKVERSVTAAMTEWLLSGEPPPGFGIDQDVELKARDGRASIRYANQTLEADEVAKHVKSGKQCTKLALTWRDKVSFLLTDKLELRRIRALDVLTESAQQDAADAGERFETEMMLMTGELSALLAELVAALGGAKATDARDREAAASTQQSDPIRLAA
ncbi:MAG TPA: recombination-associated protein RdgC [Burkholderiaceae bacterium]|nr:recombination-associated protein RdgC [Burkholderiaceae bacterium]